MRIRRFEVDVCIAQGAELSQNAENLFLGFRPVLDTRCRLVGGIGVGGSSRGFGYVPHRSHWITTPASGRANSITLARFSAESAKGTWLVEAKLEMAFLS